MLTSGFDISIKVRPPRRRPGPPENRAVWSIGPVKTRDFDARTPRTSTTKRRRAPGRSKPQEMHMLLTADQEVGLSVQFTDRSGNLIDRSQVGSLNFSSSDETIVSITDNGDGTAVATTVGPLGDVVISVTNDTDEDGTSDFYGSLAISVVAGEVAEIRLAAGEPVSRFDDEETPVIPPQDPEPTPDQPQGPVFGE